MGQRNDQSKTRKLDVRKETLRNLRSISDDGLRQAVGGMWQPTAPTRCCAPSLSGC